MDVTLKVTEGSKAGTKIAVKKDKFLIGRSPECHLCAGSTSISRKHCMIRRDGSHLFIADLGSRNGTVINGKKIKGEVELKSGDEIGIGNLQFLLTVTAGINNQKKPQVKSVAEAVERSASNSTGSSVLREDDITQWLLDLNEPAKEFTETQTIRMDDTKAGQMRKAAEDPESVKDAAEGSKSKLIENKKEKDSDDDSAKSETSDSSVLEGDAGDSDVGDSKSKKKKKQEPGKLPPIEKQSSKDSREAAVEALRAWSRRR